jgi:haloalkane dehalogenase
LVRHLDLRDITLVVHDFGGPIGLGLFTEEPERVARVMIANTWAWPHGADPRVRRLSSLVRSWLGRMLYLRFNASPRWLLPASFADRRRLTPEIHRQYLAPFSDASARTAPWVLGCELAGSDPWYGRVWAERERLAAIPMSIVWGLEDPAFDASYLARWTEAFPHAAVTALHGVGHFPQEEAPDALLSSLERLLLARGASR